MGGGEGGRIIGGKLIRGGIWLCFKGKKRQYVKNILKGLQ